MNSRGVWKVNFKMRDQGSAGTRDDETPFVVQWFVKHNIEVWSVKEGQQRFDSHVDKRMNYIRYWQASE